MIRLDNGPLYLGNVLKDVLSTTNQGLIRERNFLYTGSGKAALSIALKYLREQGILQDKMAQILVPEWLGIAVYQTLQAQCFVSTTYTEKTSVVMAYHQYGFPQNMDKVIDFCDSKKVVLIEDCAHVIDSKYNNKNLGTFGDFSIYSFSKFCFCFALGGIRFKDDKFLGYYRDQTKNSSPFHRFLINAFKLCDEFFLNYDINFQNVREMMYSLYPKNLKSSELAQRLYAKNYKYAVECRQNNYNFLWDELGGYGILDHLERENVVPYAVPLLIKKNVKEIREDLYNHDINVDEYWFDVNRFVVEPKFIKCLLLPTHSNIPTERLAHISHVIKKHL